MGKNRTSNQPNSQPTGPEPSGPSEQQVEQARAEQSESETKSPTEAPKEVKFVSIPDDVPVQTAVIEDAPDVVEASHGLSNEEFYRLHAAATQENDKADFMKRLITARQAPAPVLNLEKPQMSERVMEQTNAELAAGAALVEKHAAQQANRAPHPVDKGEGNTVSVFRPADYIPDQKKGQGNVVARTL
jgi:hypothetical protein